MKLIRGKEIVETHYKKWKLEDLQRDVGTFRASFEQAHLRDFNVQLGQALYAKLMARILSDVPKGTPIIIVPDGVLATLPFEALVSGGKPAWKKGPWGHYPDGLTYLGDEYPVSYYQSITALTMTRTAPKTGSKSARLLIVADPVFHVNDTRAQSAQSATVSHSQEKLHINLMAAIEDSGGGIKLSRLPETEILAKKLQQICGGSSDVIKGLNATRSNFLDKLGPRLEEYRWIVLATHGLFSNKIPGVTEPFMALTMVPPGTDGFLRMSDVTGLKMNADVVALTACQTGLGNEVAGEGVMSMGRAFQYAGAKSVLMSLWSVAEGSSVDLVESFFAHLQAGGTKRAALKHARDHIRKSGYDHPFFWAPFILVGEAE